MSPMTSRMAFSRATRSIWDIQNLTDADPPFYNGTSKPSEVHSQAGENIFISNPIGRIISLGFRAVL